MKGIFQRDKLLSGRPTTEDGIKDEIRNGGAGMAAYKYTLNDADLNAMAGYLRLLPQSPPPDPRTTSHTSTTHAAPTSTRHCSSGAATS